MLGTPHHCWMPIPPPWSVSTTQRSKYLSEQKLLLWGVKCNNPRGFSSHHSCQQMSEWTCKHVWTSVKSALKTGMRMLTAERSAPPFPTHWAECATKGTRERNWTPALTDDDYAKARQKICWLISFIKPKITPLKNPDFMNKSNAFIKETFTAIFYTLF